MSSSLFHVIPSTLSTSPPLFHIFPSFSSTTPSPFFQSLYPLLPCYLSPLFHINLFSFIPLPYLFFLFSSSQSFSTHQQNFKLKKHSSHEYAASQYRCLLMIKCQRSFNNHKSSSSVVVTQCVIKFYPSI